MLQPRNAESDLNKVLESLFPPGVVVDVAGDEPVDHGLLPEEESSLEGAGAKRRREFAAARACARHALERLGKVRVAIGVGAGREPVWPPGIVGSLTHCDGLRAAALALQGRILGLGFDAEPLTRTVEPAVASEVCTVGEVAWMETTPEGTPWPLVFFSAKESVYKCYSLGMRRLGFQDVALAVDTEQRRFAAHFQPARGNALPDGARLAGGYLLTSRHVITATAVTTEILGE